MKFPHWPITGTFEDRWCLGHSEVVDASLLSGCWQRVHNRADNLRESKPSTTTRSVVLTRVRREQSELVVT